MSVRVNGGPVPLPSPATVAGLLMAHQLQNQRVAVELNGRIIPRSQWETTVLAAGDVIEMVKAIGGG